MLCKKKLFFPWLLFRKSWLIVRGCFSVGIRIASLLKTSLIYAALLSSKNPTVVEMKHCTKQAFVQIQKEGMHLFWSVYYFVFRFLLCWDTRPNMHSRIWGWSQFIFFNSFAYVWLNVESFVQIKKKSIYLFWSVYNFAFRLLFKLG